MQSFKKKFVGDRAFYAMILSVTVPIMVQNGITSFVNMLDNIMVGRIGTEPFSGVSIVNQLYTIYIVSMFGGVGGVGVYTAQYFGSKDMEGVRRTVRYRIWMALLLTAAFFIILQTRAPQLLSLFLNDAGDGADLEATLDYALEYLHIIYWQIPAFMLLQIYSSTLREAGKTKIPMYAGVTAVLVNFVLNYILIFGHFGLPALGVKGAAIATVAARYVEAGITVSWPHTHKEECPYIVGLYRTLLVPAVHVKNFFLKGFPLLVNESLWSIGQSMLLQCYSMRGLNVIVAHNISNTLSGVFSIVIIALGNAVAIVVGQKLGAGDLESAKDTDNKILFTTVALSVFAGGLMAIAAPFFPMFYNTNPDARQLATRIILVTACFQPVHAFYNAAYFTLRAGGKTVITFLFDGFYMMVINLPIAFVLCYFTTLPVVAVLTCVLSADFIKCVLGAVLIHKNVWLNNLTAE